MAGVDVPSWLQVIAVRRCPWSRSRSGRWINRLLCMPALRRAMHGFMQREGEPRSSSESLPTLQCGAGWFPQARCFYDAMDDFPVFHRGLRACGERAHGERYRRPQRRVQHFIVFPGGDAAVAERECACGAEWRGDRAPACVRRARAAFPNFGYIGTLGPWFDWRWLAELATAWPDRQVEIHGPVYRAPDVALPANVHLLPPLPHEQALAKMSTFAAGLIPFLRNELTDSVDPVKFYEYRALGLPVVSTAFGEMRERAGDPRVLLTDAPSRERQRIEVLLAGRDTAESVSVPPRERLELSLRTSRGAARPNMNSLVHRIARAPMALLRRSHPLIPVLHRYMVLQLIRRDIRSRYEGSIIGLGWTLLYPLLILGAYTFVFRSVFKARWPGGADSTAEFALQVFAGLIIFNLFGELLGRAPKLVLEQPNLVKRVVFPLEILAWVAVGTAMFHGALALAVMIAALLWTGAGLTPWVLLVPLVLACCVPFMLGLAWLLSALGVFIRDIHHAMGPTVSMLLFLSPVLYPTKALPDFLSVVLLLNPLTVPIENLRHLAIEGIAPDWQGLAVYTAIGIVFAWAAHRLFERLRPAFADEVDVRERMMTPNGNDDARLLRDVEERCRDIPEGAHVALEDLEARDKCGAKLFALLAARFGCKRDDSGRWLRERVPKVDAWLGRSPARRTVDGAVRGGFRLPHGGGALSMEYRHMPLHGMGAWREGRLVAFYGGMSRDVLHFGKPERVLQIGDIMTAARRTHDDAHGAVALAATTYIERTSGYGMPFLFGYGFPSVKSLRIGERMRIYEEVDQMLELSWSPADSFAAGLDAMVPIDAARARTVDSLWRAMAGALNHSVVGVRDWAYLADRFGTHPVNKYETLLVRNRFTMKPKGVVVCRDRGDNGLEVLDLRAPVR